MSKLIQLKKDGISERIKKPRTAPVIGTAQSKHTSPFWIWLTIDWLTSTEDELTRCILINKKTSSHELNFVD